MQITVVGVVCCVMVLSSQRVHAEGDDEGSSCTKVDFDEATLTSLRKCDYMQEFVVKRYDESDHFDPFRPEAQYYLSNKWEGLTCGETVATYAFNTDTELRMAYNLVFDSGATLEVRVFDLERVDPESNPTLVEVWRTGSSTEGWGFFRERLNKTVKQAKIQIEANINAKSDLAIEYLTIFNYEVETDECSSIDEFSTTLATPTSTEAASTETISTTVLPETSTTTEQTTTTEQLTTTTLSPETTTLTTEETFPTTDSSTDGVTTSTTIQASEEFTTTSMEQTSSASVASSTTHTTTTTNAPRDDTSVQPSSSQPTTATQTTESSIPISSTSPSASVPEDTRMVSSEQWLWMTLTAMFATLFVIVGSGAIYLCYVNLELDRIVTRLLDEADYYPQKKSDINCIVY
ncbi:uncharacterized protein LOC128730652 [Anopheles nili]|uniref:uncharacterized protein LOC128730652 n=1 Tax=Anopheles nili TaxID=185578 RepID=UPI00237ACFB0|nr:uncharacterized protein LOC128730652 [Anopheles nili]